VSSGKPRKVLSQIFAIGGGDLAARETFPFDKMVVEATGRVRPWALCIPTAAQDDPEVCQAFGHVYGDTLRCRTDYLRLFRGEKGGDSFQRKLARNEIFYFCDGDADKLYDTITQFNLVDGLKAAYDRGAIFCGLGVGAAFLGSAGILPSSTGLGLTDFQIGCVKEGQCAREFCDSLRPGQADPSCVILEYMTMLNVRQQQYRLFSPLPNTKAVTRHANLTASTEYRSLAELRSIQA